MSYLYQEAEKFIKDIFWTETHNKANTLNLPEVIKEKLIKDNKEKDPDYYEHREGVVHVSSLSKCLRGVIHEMLGAQKDAPPDARKLGVFKAGNLFEDFIVDALGNKMLDRQTEYIYKYKNILLTGRDDGTIFHEGIRTLLEAKSVHSDSFWYREQEGTLVASHNQQQIQSYLWLRRILPNVFQITKDGSVMERLYSNMSEEEIRNYKVGYAVQQIEKPDNSELNGIFSYISKDDCTIIGAPVRFNQRIIDETVIPVLDLIAEAYEKKDPTLCPNPSLVAYSDTKHQWQKNWLCTYCEYHCKCAGAGWVLEASNLVTQKNREAKASAFGNLPHLEKKGKPIIGVDPAIEGGDKTVVSLPESNTQ